MPAMNGFADCHFIVTGAASGIGLATARLLHDQGAQLTLWDIDAERLTEVGQALGVETAVLDVTQPEAVTQAMARAVAAAGPLSGLIHSAGVIRTGPFADVSLNDHQRIIAVNLLGSLNVAHAAIPHVRSTRGSLVFLSSISAFYGPPEYTSYGASKAGVLNFAQALRLELEEDGIHVGVVCPAFVDTPMLMTQNTRLFRRFGVAHHPEQVATTILRGMKQRRFMLWPSRNPAFFHFLSKAGYPLGHALMRLFWGK